MAEQTDPIVVVEVYGGLVTGVRASTPHLQVYVVDWDMCEMEEGDKEWVLKENQSVLRPDPSGDYAVNEEVVPHVLY